MRYVYRFGLEDHMGFQGDDSLNVEKRSSKHMNTERYCRDISNWMHVVVSSDGLGNANSFRLYVNGVEHNYSDGGSYDRTADSYSHSDVNFRIGAHENGGSVFDGLVSQFYFIDGQALGPEAFGVADEDWGHWKPIEYEGSFNSNSFYLPFNNSGTKHIITSAGGDVKHSVSRGYVTGNRNSSITVTNSGITWPSGGIDYDTTAVDGMKAHNWTARGAHAWFTDNEVPTGGYYRYEYA